MNVAKESRLRHRRVRWLAFGRSPLHFQNNESGTAKGGKARRCLKVAGPFFRSLFHCVTNGVFGAADRALDFALDLIGLSFGLKL
jgi:hypothetical protein